MSMIRSSVTISLVPEARGGPFVFWDDLENACLTAKKLNFDAVEIFAPNPETLKSTSIKKSLADNGLALSAVGTGRWLGQTQVASKFAKSGGTQEGNEFY